MSAIWNIQDPSSAVSEPLDELPYSPLLLKLLQLGGFKDAASAQRFLFPELEHLYDPFLMKGMRRASARILAAAEKKETILVHGDYDVDGITGASLLVLALRKLNADVISFLPNRKRDGYGVSPESLKLAREKGAALFITVDCGITAFDEARAARAEGIDVIIIDHHRIHDGQVPEVFEILNPLQEDCSYPFKELSACGLAFKLAQALLGNGAFELLDLVALSSICDVAPLVDENRTLVIHGLELLSKRSRQGFRSLCQVAGLKRRRITASDLGFILGPRINAAGRMSSPETALELLTSSDTHEADRLAKILDAENRSRRDEQQMLLKQALQLVEREVNFNRDRVIVVAREGWHEGVIGIVAQRLVEYFGRPAIVIACEGVRGKGSGRSVKGFHLFEGFQYCESVLEEFGGHELAAGLVIDPKNISAFREKMNEYARKVPDDVFCRSVRIDLEIFLRDLSPQFLHELLVLEPFGAANPRPVFMTRSLETKGKVTRLGENRLRSWVTDGELTFEVIWRTRNSDSLAPPTGQFTLVYSPAMRVLDGMEHVVLEALDVRAESV